MLIVLAFLAVFMGPMDGFRHGRYYEEISTNLISEEDWRDNVSLKEDYEIEFMPTGNYLNGISVIYDQPDDNEGTLVMTILDNRGTAIESIPVDLSRVESGTWYKSSFKSALKKGQVYRLRFSTGDCKYYPELRGVDKGYLPDEMISGDVLIAYSYARSTFNPQERTMIFIVMIAAGLFVSGLMFENRRGLLNSLAMMLFLAVVLSWNYTHNSIDVENDMFAGFQMDSELLVRGVIDDERENGNAGNAGSMGYGLGYFYDLKEDSDSSSRVYHTDEYWDNGYSRTEPAITVNPNKCTPMLAVPGNTIEFSNGEELTITEIGDDNGRLVLRLDHNGILNPLKYGDLDDAVFYDQEHNKLPKGDLALYSSQYGLQGKIFRHLARYMNEDDVYDNLYLICSLAAALVFVLICMILARKYNMVMAGCFYFVFWLSPWITCFARNLYWVEFTWFIPMLAGLFCAWKADDTRCRIGAYAAAYISILLKCLCGYEYISTILMGLISFLLVDSVAAVVKKDKERSVFLIKTIVVMGILALMGFMTAILIHARLKGNGDIIFGIKEIIQNDVLRRTGGADMNNFPPVYWESFNASVWETLCKYFKFNTQIITGIKGNLFPILCIVPLCIFIYDYRKHSLDAELPAMYIVFFLSSISWFCLAKGHSYIHTHINFVMWYFGFVQICFYVIVNKLVKVIRH